MHYRTLKCCAALLVLCFCLVPISNAYAYRYNANNYDLTPRNDRIEQNKPVAFNYEAAKKQLLAEEDFEDGQPASGSPIWGGTSSYAAYENGVLKIE